MEKLLLIQITPEDAILNLAQRMHIRTVSVSPNDYQKSIGQLAGFPDQTATHTSDGTSLDGSMLIFCDVKERHQNQILEKLHQDRVELALVRSPFSAEGIQKVPLQTESLIAVGHHSFFSEADTISLQELAERPLIIYRRWEHILNQTFRTLELPVSYFCVNEDARTTVYWADAGLGIGIVPESACSLLQNPKTRIVPISDSLPDTTIYLVRREQAYLAPHTKFFWEGLQKHCKR